jgi:hypothetical protein
LLVVSNEALLMEPVNFFRPYIKGLPSRRFHHKVEGQSLL